MCHDQSEHTEISLRLRIFARPLSPHTPVVSRPPTHLLLCNLNINMVKTSQSGGTDQLVGVRRYSAMASSAGRMVASHWRSPVEAAVWYTAIANITF
jgi:hypothetical protein